MIKKIFSISLSLLLLFSFSQLNAQNNNTSNGYNAPIEDSSLNFEAKIVDGSVHMEWDSFSKDEKFKYYKVVKSSNNSNPVYPDDSYIKYMSDVNETDYIDYKLLNGTTYYRVCAITHEMNRYCSNVVKLFNDNVVVCTADYTPVCGYKDGKYKTYSNKCNLTADNAYKKYYGECKTNSDTNTNTSYDKISSSLKLKSKRIINSFIAKLEKKGYSNDKNIEIIDGIMVKIETLKKDKPKSKEVLNYLAELLIEKKSKYEDDFSEIEDIFNLN